ncbi:uncharacterized protein TNCV_2500531 [Trichonephila clavipes]|nr:uncharacterized protein TNCV_2500531 [Trichonephila clavipes]
MIVGSSSQRMVLPQEDRIPEGHGALLREKTAVFERVFYDASGVKPELLEGWSEDLLCFLVKAGSALVPRMAMCCILYSVGMLPWSTRLTDLSPIEHVWDIIERQLQTHPKPALTVPLKAQVQQTLNNIPQGYIRHLCDTLHVHLLACIQNSGGYTAYICNTISHLK